MSNSVYPSLPGVTLNVTRAPLWKTLKQETTSGREYRGSFMLYPRYRYTLSYDVLRDVPTHLEYRSLFGFFNLMKGGYDTFLFTDADDSSVTDMQFGVGTGSATAFQLFRTFGGFTDPVFDLNGAPVIKVAGVTKATPADYSISSTGVVTFTSAPANGAALTWTGAFYWRCSFEDDTIDFGKFMNLLWEVKKISFRTCKP